MFVMFVRREVYLAAAHVVCLYVRINTPSIYLLTDYYRLGTNSIKRFVVIMLVRVMEQKERNVLSVQ